MRRKDKEVTDTTILEEVLHRAPVCRLGLSEDNRPYVVPMNFGYHDNCLYLHSAGEGKKIDIIRHNPYVCFQTDSDLELIAGDKPCNWSMKYLSVIGFGKAALLEEREEKRKGLDIIVRKYEGKGSFPFPDDALDKLAVIRVEIENMTGKKSRM